jgi:hypothetical protein
MSDTGKQSPLGVNSLSSLLQNVGLTINPEVTNRAGSSKSYTNYTFGSIVEDSCLRLLTYAINDAYTRGVMSTATYDNLISIGDDTIPALGNSKPPTYTWSGPANICTSESEVAQTYSWLPYDNSNDITQWGYIRLPCLQAWNDFNYNGDGTETYPIYKDFVQSWLMGYAFVDYSNVAITAMATSPTFLDGTYSNMDDLISADITGVNLATKAFGQDLIKTGKVIDLSKIDSFGLPSVLLKTLRKYNAITQSLSLALIASGLETTDTDKILNGVTEPTELQESQIYGAFTVIVGVDLQDILIPLNCSTSGLESLADLLNPLKLLPNSYMSLTVPLYNASPGPTNSKTYYPVFGTGSVNPALSSPTVVTQVGAQIPSGQPQVKAAVRSTSNFGRVIQAVTSNGTSYEGLSSGFTTGGASEATAKAQADYLKFKTNQPGPGYVFNETSSRWISPEEASLNSLGLVQQRQIARAYATEKYGEDAVIIANPGDFDLTGVTQSKSASELLDWAKSRGLLP